jgi:hypothetical protein
MSLRRQKASESAKGEQRPCAQCGKPRWVHLLKPAERRQFIPRDDGHSFKPKREGEKGRA